MLGILIIVLFFGDNEEKQSDFTFLHKAAAVWEKEMLTTWAPVLSFADTKANGIWWTERGGTLNLFSFLEKEEPVFLQAESGWTREDIIRAEGQDEYSGSNQPDELETPQISDGRITVGEDMVQQLLKENQQTNETEISTEESAEGTEKESDSVETEHADAYVTSENGIQQLYQWEYYEKYDALMNEFYAVDSSTVIDESQLNLEDLLTPDMSIDKRTDDEPQILIYHTHSQESFADSVEGDPATTIMGVGQVLARLLEDRYGYNVMHHLGQYDVENRDYAYNTALPVMEQLLREYPSIEVVIDLHRDEVAEGTKLVTEIEGRPTARFMFFNGLSRTRKHGDIEYLPNENIVANLAFSFQMQALCNQFYPGLTRRIYLKGYRYNMHLKARYLLVEMGAQTNTYQECYNACIPLARMLDLELSGFDLGYLSEEY